jgi:FeS assembly SUF system protein
MDPHPSGQHHIPVPRPLPVLSHSGKVEELKQEALAAAQAMSPVLTAESPAAAAEPHPDANTDPARSIQKKLLEGKIIEALRQIYDPEIPVNIYDLGLIYEIDVKDDDSVKVKMTLTAPACPVAGTLPGEVETKVNAVPEVKAAEVELVWEPAWSRDRMSEAALLQLGMF